MSGINDRQPTAKHSCQFCNRRYPNLAKLKAHETNTRRVSPIVQSSDGKWQFHPYCAAPQQDENRN